MKKVIDNLKQTYLTSAKVVDGTLILSVPSAITPAVWRLDLGNVKASSLEVRDEKEENFTLVLSTPKGDVHDVASFYTKGEAIEALLAVTAALESAQGQIKPGLYAASNDIGQNASQNRLPVPSPHYQSPPPASKKTNKALASVAGVLILVVMIVILMNLGPKTATLDGNSPSTSAASSSPSTLNGTSGAGVPMSANDFLMNR
jgi:hypothetical protein